MADRGTAKAVSAPNVALVTVPALEYGAGASRVDGHYPNLGTRFPENMPSTPVVAFPTLQYRSGSPFVSGPVVPPGKTEGQLWPRGDK